jgi:hypothetical protein
MPMGLVQHINTYNWKQNINNDLKLCATLKVEGHD